MLESRQSVPPWFLVWPLFLCTLNSCHKFSIGLRSGDSAGIFNQLMPFSSMNSFACLDVCFGSLSCINLWPSGYTSSRKDRSVQSKIMVYKGPFIFPSKMQIAVLPRQLIPAPTWPFGGCLTLEKMCLHTWKIHYNFKKATVKKISYKYIISARCQSLCILGLILGWFSVFAAAEKRLCDCNCTVHSSV